MQLSFTVFVQYRKKMALTEGEKSQMTVSIPTTPV